MSADQNFTGTMHRKCGWCETPMGTKPCAQKQDGLTSVGICPSCDAKLRAGLPTAARVGRPRTINPFTAAGSATGERSAGGLVSECSGITHNSAEAGGCDSDLIGQAISKLRTRSGYWNGDHVARQVLTQLLLSARADTAAQSTQFDTPAQKKAA
jgi:hypothetical protein